jgi:hypothetical protein
MNEGDAYYFDSTKPYRGRRIGAKPARILVVFTSTEGKVGLKKRREGRPASRSPRHGRS